MKRNLLLGAAMAVACASPLCAAPVLQFVDNFDNTATLQVVTDATGSLGAEIAVEIVTGPGLQITGASVNTAVWDFANPGDNPYIPGLKIGGDSTGLWTDLANNRLFASFGSGVVGVGTFDFLTLDYSGYGSLEASGWVAQLGQLGGFLQAGFGTLNSRGTYALGIPEPTTAALVGLALTAAFGRRRAG